MPGFDGTGPRGYGPMTGGSRGYCVLKIPSKHDEPVTGFAGLSGRPVSLSQGGFRPKLATLRIEFQRIGRMIDNIRRRMLVLETMQSGAFDKEKASAFKRQGL
jgi:hypothetical protein